MKIMNEDWRSVEIAPFKGKVMVGSKVFAVRAPDTPLQLVRGYREMVPTSDECMIFPYHNLVNRTFTMDNCVANLLICFCIKGDRHYTCVDVKEGKIGIKEIKSSNIHDTVFEFLLESAPKLKRGSLIKLLD